MGGHWLCRGASQSRHSHKLSPSPSITPPTLWFTIWACTDESGPRMWRHSSACLLGYLSQPAQTLWLNTALTSQMEVSAVSSQTRTLSTRIGKIEQRCWVRSPVSDRRDGCQAAGRHFGRKLRDGKWRGTDVWRSDCCLNLHLQYGFIFYLFNYLLIPYK